MTANAIKAAMTANATKAAMAAKALDTVVIRATALRDIVSSLETATLLNRHFPDDLQVRGDHTLRITVEGTGLFPQNYFGLRCDVATALAIEDFARGSRRGMAQQLA